MMIKALLLLLVAGIACTRTPDPIPIPSSSSSPSSSSPATATPAPPSPRIEDEYEDEDEDGGRRGASSVDTVTIKLTADARRQARVSWGRKDLGTAPLEIVRPRGSGPLDLLVVAPGCLPLHTRVFTDRDDTLALRLYTEREAAGLPGYSPNRDVAPSPANKPQRRF
jgi:hypothetical protein